MSPSLFEAAGVDDGAPRPLAARPTRASRIAWLAYMPVATSQAETPTRPASAGAPVIEASPVSAWISRS